MLSDQLMAAEPVPAARLGRVHFAGIGGAGMSGIARIMLARGIAVSGSDARDSALLGELRELGASVHVGHERFQCGGDRLSTQSDQFAKRHVHVARPAAALIFLAQSGQG